jgi:hypothetical protein
LKTGLDMLGINIYLEQSRSKVVSNSTPLPPNISQLIKSSRKRSISDHLTTTRSAKRAKVSPTSISNAFDFLDSRPTMFKCNFCNMNFKFRKGLNSHNQRNHEQENNGQEGKVAKYVASNVVDTRNESSKHSKQRDITSFFSLQQSKSYPQTSPPS